MLNGVRPLSLADLPAEPRLRPVFESETPAVVVFPVSHAVGLSVIRTLEDHGIPILAVDFKPRAAGLYSNRVSPLLLPELGRDEAAFESGMIEIGRRFRTRPVLFLVHDEYLFPSLKNQPAWERVYRIPLSPWPVVETIVDKGRFYRRLAEAGYPIPRTWFMNGAADLEAQSGDITFPCILKPTYSTAFRRRFGVKARRFDDLAALSAFAREVSAAGIAFLVQEFIEGPAEALWTYAAYSDDDGNVLAEFTGRKRHQFPPDFGTCRLGESVASPELAALGRRLLKILGYRGISLTEFKRGPDGAFKVIELNPRPGDWPERLAQLCGANLVLAAYRASVGLPVAPATISRFGVKWANLAEDFYYSVRGYRLAGYPEAHRGFLGWLRDLGGVETDAFWSWRDPMPALVRFSDMMRDFARREREWARARAARTPAARAAS
ncbi:MAG: hypothetical protein WCF16_12905 [Alphaproteobacteria bacterium]